MPFIKIEGFTGNIYVPEKNPGKKKHRCRDCYSCRFCSDQRCELCLKNRSGRKNNTCADKPVNNGQKKE